MLHKKSCESCTNVARYGKKFDIRKRCKIHKHHDDIDIKHQHLYCKKIGCLKRAYYGEKNKQAMYCTLHYEDNHIHLSIPTCRHPNCYSLAIYGKANMSLHCKEHKEYDEYDLGKSKKYRNKSKEELMACLRPKRQNKTFEKIAIHALQTLGQEEKEE